MTTDTTSTPAASIDPKAFRYALGRFPTGVTIITGIDPQSNARTGLTVSSFNSLSLSPALVLWSISARSPSLPAFTPGRFQCIHVLHAGQADLAKQFAVPKPDKFDGVGLKPSVDPLAPPQLEDCAAVFHCTTDRLIEAGDHFLVIAAVRAFEAYADNSLVFCKSQFLSSEALSKIDG